MWTYHEEPGTILPKQKQTENMQQEDTVKNKSYIQEHSEPPKKELSCDRRAFWYLSGIYLCGLLAGSIYRQVSGDTFRHYIEYFAQARLLNYQDANISVIFSTCFLTSWIQLTGILILGLNVIGKWFIPLLLFLIGSGTGCFWSVLYQKSEISVALLTQLLIFLIPEVLGVLMSILLSTYALQLSDHLYRCCFRGISVVSPVSAVRLIRIYLILCLSALLPCGIASASVLIFGGICGFS